MFFVSTVVFYGRKEKYFQYHDKILFVLFVDRLKEELIRELVKTGKESEALNKTYYQKIKKLEKVSCKRVI